MLCSSLDFLQKFFCVISISTIVLIYNIYSTTTTSVMELSSSYYLTKIILPSESITCNQTWTSFIVPYRNRSQHLGIFVQAIRQHQLLRNEGRFEIIVVEQLGQDPFNRGKLLNVGAMEAIRERLKKCTSENAYQNLCLIFHDIDMIPQNQEIPYNCTLSPILLSTAAEQFNFTRPYPRFFGGVSAFSWLDFYKLRGFPNRFWGWGGEDDDVSKRLKYSKLRPKFLPESIGVFSSLKHDPGPPSGSRWSHLKRSRTAWDYDGLNDLNYVIESSKDLQHFKQLYADLKYGDS